MCSVILILRIIQFLVGIMRSFLVIARYFLIANKSKCE